MRLTKNFMRKKIKWILILIFLIILACRLYFVFQTPYFNDEGYLDYRLVQEISETGKPLFYDELSYDGRSLLYSPAYHYILAFFDIFLPLEFVLKVIPNFFISLLVFVVFNLVNVLVRNQNIALFAALLSGFVPILFVEILNNISVYSLVVPLVFYLLYLFIQIKEGKNATKFAILGFLLAILHPSAFLLLIALIFFTILIVSEGMMVDKSKKEIVAFFTFLVLFIEFLIYKKAFLIYGFNIVKGNVPVQVLDNFFTFNFLEIVLKVGILFIVLGLISIIWGWKKKREDVVLISSLILSSLMLLWFKVIELKVGLMFLGVALIIMSSISFKLFLKYLDKTKFYYYLVYYCLVS
jgi:4-amino-4-deoxy-L-arabinose transferase-like glycosyltransferase